MIHLCIAIWMYGSDSNFPIDEPVSITTSDTLQPFVKRMAKVPYLTYLLLSLIVLYVIDIFFASSFSEFLKKVEVMR